MRGGVCYLWRLGPDHRSSCCPLLSPRLAHLGRSPGSPFAAGSYGRTHAEDLGRMAVLVGLVSTAVPGGGAVCYRLSGSLESGTRLHCGSCDYLRRRPECWCPPWGCSSCVEGISLVAGHWATVVTFLDIVLVQHNGKLSGRVFAGRTVRPSSPPPGDYGLGEPVRPDSGQGAISTGKVRVGKGRPQDSW